MLVVEKKINQQEVSIYIDNFNPDNITYEKEITSNFFVRMTSY